MRISKELNTGTRWNKVILLLNALLSEPLVVIGGTAARLQQGVTEGYQLNSCYNSWK